MTTMFTGHSAFIIRNRGLVLAGWVTEGTARLGMAVHIESFPRPLFIDEIEMINTSGELPGLIGLLFLSTDQNEMRLWKRLDVKDKVFEVRDNVQPDRPSMRPSLFS